MTAGAISMPRGSPTRTGRTVAVLYFANSVGATVGVLVEGFVLIGAFGLPGTLVTAAALNALVAVTVVLVVRYAHRS